MITPLARMFPENTFTGWLFRGGWWLSAILTSSAAAGFFGSYVRSFNIANARGRIALAQLLALLAALIVFIWCRRHRLASTGMPKPSKVDLYLQHLGFSEAEWSDVAQKALISADNFYRALAFAIGTWAALYLVLVLESFLSPWVGTVSAFAIIEDILNALSNGAFIVCYIQLTHKSSRQQAETLAWSIFAFLLLLLFSVPSIVCAAHRKEYLDTCLIFGGILSGIIAGCAMALNVSRLSSSLIGAPVWLLVFLSVYACIQPFYPVIHGVFGSTGQSVRSVEAVLVVVILAVAGISKLVFLLFLYYSIKSGRLLFYFVQSASLAKSVPTDWTMFHELVKAGQLETVPEA